MSKSPAPSVLQSQVDAAPVSLLVRLDTLWLHGAGLAGDTWDHITVDCPRAVSPDLPGHGLAPQVAPPRVATYADAVAGNLRPGAVVIGHSLGGMVALELAARAEPPVGALILIEAVPTVRDRLTGRMAAGFARGLFGAIPTSWMARLAGTGESVETRNELRRQLTRMDRAGIAAALEAAAHYDGRPRLSEVQVPTLVIVGTKSTATHHGANLMARNIRGAEFCELPGGHMLHTDSPGPLLRCIDDFLRRSFPG